MPNPFDQFDNGPVYGPPPKSAGPPAGYRSTDTGLEYIPGGPADPHAPKPDKTNYRTLTQDEAAAMGLPPGRRYQVSSEGKVDPIGGEDSKTQPSYDDRTKLMARGDAVKLLNKRIDDLTAMYQKDFAGGGPGALVEYLPGSVRPENANFDAAARALLGDIASAQGLTAQQQNTPTELEIRFGPFIPKASDRDEVIQGKLQRLRDIVGSQLTQINTQRNQLSLPPVSLDDTPQAPGGQAPPPQGPSDPVATAPQLAATYEGSNGGVGNQMVPATTYRQVDDPALTALKGEYLRRLGGGQSAGQILQWAQQAGVPIDAGFARTVAEQAKFRREHPEVKISQYDVSAFDDRYVPTTEYQKAMTEAADTAPGAAALRAGNAVTGNNLDSIVGMTGGNAEQARMAIDDAARRHPVAATVGDIGGGVTAALGGEAALARVGMGAGIGRTLLADTAYGTVSGAGAADDGDRVSGAVKGGLAALAGSLGGRAVTKGLASTVSPTGGKLANLYEAGVRPTPGQRFAETGPPGRLLNAIEEQLSSVPIVGSAIRGARQEARDQFQIGAFNDALKDVGEQLPKGIKPGPEAHRYAQKAFDRVYGQARDGMRVLPDDEMAKDIGELGGQVGTLAEPSIKRFQSIVENVVLRRAGAEIDGPAYKKIQSEIGRIVRGIRKSPSGDGELAEALEGLSGVLDRAARRHSDPASVAAMDAADRGYAKFVRIELASKRGGLAKDAGTFSPNDLAAAVKGEGGRVRSKAYNQGEALMQPYADAGKTLSDRVPNSGTAERQMAGLTVAGGAGYLEPNTLGVLGVLGALYAPGVRKLTTGALKPRGKQARALAEAIRGRKRLAGAAGTALAVQETPAGQ
jgi:hypothetical protein